MITGQKPFRGDYEPAVVYSILNAEQEPVTALRTGVPMELERVVNKALEKDPALRYQSAADLCADLKRLRRDSSSDQVTLTPPPVAAGPKRRWPWVAAVVAVAALAAGLSTLLPDKPSAPSRAMTIKPLTSFAGLECFPSWSPDGNFIAYVHTEPGPMNIYVVSTAGGEPIRLTDNPTDDLYPRWSPDGRHIAFVSERDGESHIYLIPPLGGVERKLVNTNVHYLEDGLVEAGTLGAKPWSPDGRTLVFSRRGPAGEVALWKVDLETRRQLQMTHPQPRCYDVEASWSPDGKQIAFARVGTEEKGLWLLPAAGGEPQLFLRDEFQNNRPVWSSDGKSIIFCSTRSGTENLWEVDIASGEVRQVTAGPGWDQYPVVARDGRIAYGQFSHQTDLYLMSMEDGTERRLTFHTRDNFAARFSPDGTKLVYHSSRTGGWEVWLLELESGVETRLTDNPGIDMYPEWSPDGQKIVFASDRGGTVQFWILDVESGELRLLSDRIDLQLTGYMGVSASWGPRWSPDGQVIGFIIEGEDGRSLWLMDLEGTDLRPSMSGVLGFDWYRDSNHLIYSRISDDVSLPPEMRALDLETGEETTLFEGAHLELIVAPDGSGVTYCSAASHSNMNLYHLPLVAPSSPSGLPRSSGDPLQLTRGEGLWHVHNGDWSPDGQSIVYTRDTDSGDIYVIEGY
jgi:Tol biopolymer transport system component